MAEAGPRGWLLWALLLHLVSLGVGGHSHSATAALGEYCAGGCVATVRRAWMDEGSQAALGGVQVGVLGTGVAERLPPPMDVLS